MARAETRLDRHAWKQSQAALVRRPAFIAEQIVPLVPEVAGDTTLPESAVEIVRDKAASRMTLRYTLGSRIQIYGKAYFDFSVAAHAYGSLSQLWAQGFEAGSVLKVPEPLGVVPEANLVLMRTVQGESLDRRVAAGPVEDALEGARLAARWLVQFQGTAISGLRAASPCERLEILKIADAIAKVTAECPEHSALLIDMIHGLRTLAPKKKASPRDVPMHGQFRPNHIFVDVASATVIDIEKICLSDPAKDVARFCHVLKKTCLEERGDAQRSDRIAQEFVAEYRRHVKSNLENLPYFRALFALKAFAKLLKNRKVEEACRQSMCDAYRVDFEQWVQFGRVAALPPDRGGGIVD